MRASARPRHHEDEEESAFVSMTDMTVSFLFIVMILLVFFASQLQSTDQVPRAQFEAVARDRDRLAADLVTLQAELRSTEKRLEDERKMVGELTRQLAEKDQKIKNLQAEIEQLEEKLRLLQPNDPIESYLKDVSAQRRTILEALQTQLKTDFPDLQVIISTEMDALRFKGDGLFNRGVSDLSPDKRRIVETIAARLDEILPCYTLGQNSAWSADCNPVGAVIEAVQIEGHTDADGPDQNNLNLSTARANQTFFAMVERAPTIKEHRNSRSQPVLSVAGYGEMRPVADNDTPEGKATNRRIDLRIIMYTPRSLEDIDMIRSDLRRGISASASP